MQGKSTRRAVALLLGDRIWVLVLSGYPLSMFSWFLFLSAKLLRVRSWHPLASNDMSITERVRRSGPALVRVGFSRGTFMFGVCGWSVSKLCLSFVVLRHDRGSFRT